MTLSMAKVIQRLWLMNEIRVRSIGDMMLTGEEWYPQTSQLHFAHHKSYTDWLGIGKWHPRWEAAS